MLPTSPYRIAVRSGRRTGLFNDRLTDADALGRSLPIIPEVRHIQIAGQDFLLTIDDGNARDLLLAD